MPEKSHLATKKNHSLAGRTIYIPRLSLDGARALAAVYRSCGVNARPVPCCDQHSIDLARKYTMGEECYPQIVTLGSFMKVTEENGFDPQKPTFLMPTTGGPCRFGQYRPLIEKILHENGLDDVMIVSPSSVDGYEAMGDNMQDLFRIGWWSIVCADLLRKLQLQTRPYEINPGDTDIMHMECLDLLCAALERQDLGRKDKFSLLISLMNEIAAEFSAIPADYKRTKPLIGVVGEIYCRMDEFANAGLTGRIEKYGGEVWLAQIAEWVWYTNFYQTQQLISDGKALSRIMLTTKLKNMVQSKDEHRLFSPLQQRFKGYEEADSTKKILRLADPYLPYSGVVGEMLLNIGGAVHFYSKGADGIVDISPFTCMNGIVCEAIYPKVSHDHDNIPIKNFYFDENEADYDGDIEIFLELCTTYKSRKNKTRVYPAHFSN